VPSDPDGMKKYKNKIFAKESRERKKRYVKELEIKVEALEEKVAKLSMELEQYKNLLRVSDISEIKDLKLKTVRQEFTDTKMYLREQLRSE
jgi:phosphoenolpyruvate synthase/pyruvate phosphate dikinase